MCFGGSTKAPNAPEAPAPAPTPIAPNSTGSALQQTDRAKSVASLRYGLASTLKTPTGFTGAGTQLQAGSSAVSGIPAPAPKKTLG